MKVWQKISVFLAMLVLCFGMINMPVSAATNTQDGLKVTLTTDKDTYSQSDEIKVNIFVENTNSFDVNNVSLESVIPDGLELKKDYSSSATIGTLAAGESYNCELVLQQKEEFVPVEDDENVDSEDSGEGTSTTENQSSQTNISIDKNSINQSKKANESDSVQTGDYTSFVSVIVVLILSAIVIVLLFLKRKNKIFLLLLCIVGSTIITGGDVLNTKAAEEVKQRSINVVETVSINNSEYELAVKVSYIFDDAINEYIPSKDAEIYINDNLYSDYAGDEHIKYDKDTGITYFDNELLVFFEDDMENAIAQLEDDISMTIVGKNIYDNSCLIRFDQAKEYGDLLQLCDTLNEKDYVKNVYLNYSFEKEPQYYPDDSEWSNLWAETPEGDNWGMEAIYAPKVWDFRSEMSSINVGVYDTGFDMTHPDLKNVTTTWIVGNENTDDINHGTHVAGIIGAEFDNGYGVAGVFPEANLVPFSCRINTSSDIDKLAYSYLIGEKKCRVINESLGTNLLCFAASRGEFSAQEQLKASSAVLEESLSALKSDFIICTAAGNTSGKGYQFIKRDDANYGYYEITENEDNKEIGYYDNENNWHQYSGITISGSCDAVWANNVTCISSDRLKNRIVVVGAAQLNKSSGYKLADFSNKGERVDVVAPGVGIKSTISQSGFELNEGTSMASPHVAGLAGILYSINPYVNGEQVKSVIVETATTAVSNSDGKNMINAFDAYNRFKGLYSAIGKISGKVIDEQGNPIAGASVMMTDSSINGIPFGASTDENGEFIIDSETGTHSFEIKKDGFESYEGTAKVEANTTTIILEKIVLKKASSDSLEFNGHYYKFYDNSMTWEEAKVFCEEQGGYLVVINSVEENEAISQFLAENGSKNCYWIGIYRDGIEQDWKSVTGEAIEYTNWSSGEPNNQEGQEMYIHIYGKQDPSNSDNGIGEWNDASVNGASYAGDFYNLENFGFICEYGSVDEENVLEFEDHKYRFYNNSMTWEEAKLFCEEQGGHLVTVNSLEEQRFLQENCTGEKNLYWIGLQEINNEWGWVTEEELLYTNWATGEPNEDFNDTEYYAQLYGKDYNDYRLGEWNDSRNDSGTISFYQLGNVGFICEWDNE